MADEIKSEPTPQGDLAGRVDEAKATDQDSGSDVKTVGDGGVSTPVEQTAEATKDGSTDGKTIEKSGEEKKTSTKNTSKVTRGPGRRTGATPGTPSKKEEEELKAKGVDPETGLKSSVLAGDDTRNTTLDDEERKEAGFETAPSPVENVDQSRNFDDTQASQAMTAEADPDINTDPAVLTYQTGQYDPESGQSILSVLANPPAAAVAAEDAAQARVDGTNGIDRNGDGVVDERDRLDGDRTDDDLDGDGVAKV